MTVMDSYALKLPECSNTGRSIDPHALAFDTCGLTALNAS